MSFNRHSLFQLFKYSVYVLLSLNIWFFGREEFLAAQLEYSDGIPLGSIIGAYAATIDTAAWVILLLMFELETCILEDRHFTPPVTATLHTVRAICYAFIVYSFYGYVANLLFSYDVTAASGLSDVCALAGEGWSYAVTLDEYVAITAANCASFSDQAAFLRFGELPAVVDATGLVDIQRLAWVDVINSGVWILVVALLEIDVRLQEKGLFEGIALQVSNALKFLLYAILFLAAIYWGLKGDFVDFWDAFLWLLAFFFIELNVVEWREEERAEAAA